MDILTCMSLGGSLMLLFYIILKAICKNKLSYQERWIFLIGAIAVFLIPYPQERHQYIGLLQWLFADAEWTYSFSDRIMTDSYYIIENAAGEVLLRHDIRIYITACFIIAGLVLIFGRQLYLNQKAKKYWICSGKEESSRKLLRRNIKIYSTNEVEEPLSVGVLNSVIVIPEDSLNREEKEMVIQHEMQHIRSGDLLINCICVVLISIHWFNPMVYYLVRELHHVQELRCDAKVIRAMEQKERYQYAGLILRFMKERTQKKPLVSFLSGSKGRVNERMEEITSGQWRKRNFRFFVVVMLAISMLLSTLTAIAYSPAEHIKLEDGTTIEEIERFIKNAVFVPEGEESIFLEDETIGLVKPGINVFKDEKGETYYWDINEDSKKVAECSHSYVSGQYYIHSDKEVGCIVTVYEGEYCSSCSDIAKGKEVCKREYFVECPH